MTTTAFWQSKNDHAWYWHTRGDNNVVVADGSQGYATSADATNRFYASQGVPWWTPDLPHPPGFIVSDADEDGRFTITRAGADASLAVLTGRAGRIRQLCQSAIERDHGAPGYSTSDGLTDRQWLAQSVLNIYDGRIDAQILQESGLAEAVEGADGE